jgi:hypothetical protein
VRAGGHYDRYRMNPDLDEVARDPAAGNIHFLQNSETDRRIHG